ncbi:MAG: histidine--tRNA ligase [Planctomycetota bacterium]|jgi:histidyl-tRNA synthetase
MPVSNRTFQAPKGTRDFYPYDLAVRRHIESAWRRVSVNHGFDEIDGPTFEHLDLYTVKSGPGIVSELFSFRRAGGDVDYALRPEFTPTLARMYAAKANTLAKPTRWFSICQYFRAERPQRGRLREHFQWNVDVLGDGSPAADAQIVAAAVEVLERLGLTAGDVKVKISDRHHVADLLKSCGLAEESLPAAFALLDKRGKIAPAEFEKQAAGLGLGPDDLARFGARTIDDDAPAALRELWAELEALEIAGWCEIDHSIVRGLAYYTGTVFEIHEAAGKERAIAGGGRYDELVALFGGPPTPAVGMAMGDVVIRLVLEERGLLAPAEELMPRPDVFLISAGKPEAEKQFRPLMARLRRAGLHVRQSARATRNVKKLLGDAAKSHARLAVILGEELEQGHIAIKDLDSGVQVDAVPLESLEDRIKEMAGDG